MYVYLLAVGGGQTFSVTPLLLLSFFLISTSVMLANRAERQAELVRRQEVKKKLQPATSTDYFEKLVGINIANLSAYYETVKSHANKSFATSLFVGLVGFVLIGVGIASVVRDPKNGLTVSVLAGIQAW